MDPNVNRCDICCTYFSKSPFFMYNHMKRASCLREPFNCEESTLELYHCEICQLDFNTIIFFKNHIEQEDCREKQVENSSEFYKIHVCQKCSFETYSYLLWFKHMNGCFMSTKNETDNSKYKELSQTNVIKIHAKRDNRSKNPLECEKCTFKTSYKYALKRHFNTYHATDENKKWFQCEQCPFKSTEKINLERHVYAKHTADNEKNSFICEKCPFKTTTKRYLRQHHQRLHADDKKLFKCEKCTYGTPYKCDLIRHQGTRVHERNSNCVRETTNESSLQTRIVNNRKWFQCDKCTYKSRIKDNMNVHFNSHHATEQEKKWFRCEKCPFKSAQRHNLKLHLYNRHAPEENKIWFQCEQCAYKTTLKQYLRNHRNRQHRNVKLQGQGAV